MRTISAAQNAFLLAPIRQVHVNVRIKDAGGTFVDYNDLGGRNWIASVTWSEEIDKPVMAAVVILRRKSFLQNLSPHFSAGQFAGNIQIGREIEILTAVMPDGIPPAPGDFITMFAGTIDDTNQRGDFLELPCRETIARNLAQTQIEVERNYGDDAFPVDVEEVMQDIIDDNDTTGGPPVLVVPASPLWLLLAYTQRKEHVLEAIRTLALQIGWDLRVRFNNSSGDFELTFREPDRTVVAINRVFTTGQYKPLKSIDVSVAQVRNKVRVWYDAKNGPTAENDNKGKPLRKSVLEEDVPSQTAFGLVYMEISEASSSNIDSSVEATRMAESILADIKDPTLRQVTNLPYFWPTQLDDLYTFLPNDDQFDLSQDLAVLGYQHRIAGVIAETVLQVQGKPSAGFERWLDYEVKAGNATPKRETGPNAVKTLTVSPFANGFLIDAPVSDDHPWEGMEIHRSTSDVFTPDDTTFLAYIKGTQYVDRAPLVEGTKYFYQVLAIDRDGNVSPQSNEANDFFRLILRTDFGVPLRKSFRIHQTSAQVSISGTQNVIDFGTYDHGADGALDGGFVRSTDEFTAPAGGTYMLVYRVTLGDATALTSFQATIALDPGGGETADFLIGNLQTDSSGRTASEIAVVVALDSGDRLEPRLNVVGTSMDTFAAETFFTVHPLPGDDTRT